MASSDVPSLRGTEGLRVTEDRASRKDFVQGATAGGLLRGLALAAILSRVTQGRGGVQRRQR